MYSEKSKSIQAGLMIEHEQVFVDTVNAFNFFPVSMQDGSALLQTSLSTGSKLKYAWREALAWKPGNA